MGEEWCIGRPSTLILLMQGKHKHTPNRMTCPVRRFDVYVPIAGLMAEHTGLIFYRTMIDYGATAMVRGKL